MHKTREEALAVRVLEGHIKASEAFLKEFHETADEVVSYCRDGMVKRFYEEYVPEAFMYAQVSKTAEALDIFGAGIYNKHPVNTVTPRRHASPLSAERAGLIADYQNATIRETNADSHNRKVANDGILTGRGLWQTGVDRRGLVCSKRVPIRNFLIDPDFEIEEQIAWMGRRRYSKRYALINKYPHERERLKEVQATRGVPSDFRPQGDNFDGTKPTEGSIEQDGTHDLIEYYELYYRVGLANFTGSLSGTGAD